jgi:hypothetical protein
MPGPRSRGNLAKKRVIPFKRGKKEVNKRRLAKTTDEKTHVKIRFVEQIKGMGWNHIDGDIDVPYLSDRETLGIEGKHLAIREDTLFYPAEEKLS